MKAILVVMMTIFATSALALNWAELEIGEQLSFDQNISLPIKVQNTLNIQKGFHYTVDDFMGLDGINVVLIKGTLKECPSESVTSDMEIIKVETTEEASEVGLLLEKNCSLSIFIENIDLNKPSFFIQ